MRTAIEVGRDGQTPLRVYHSTQRPAVSAGYAWTHAPDKDTRDACSACTSGTIPKSIRSGRAV